MTDKPTEDFTIDAEIESDLNLSTLGGLKPKTTISSLEELRLFLAKKFEENDKLQINQHKILRMHDKSIYGYKPDKAGRGEAVQGLVEKVKMLEDWKLEQHEKAKKIKYMIGGIMLIAPFILALVTAVVKSLLAKVGVNM